VKGRTILLGRYEGREAAALMVDGRLDDLLVEPPADRALPGAIYRALPDRPVKGMGGMFLRLPSGSAFLRQTKGLAPGKPVLVQVTGFAERGKAVPVTTRLVVKGRNVVVTPGAPGRNVSRQIADKETRAALSGLAEAATLPEHVGLILRSAAADSVEDEVAREVGELSDLVRRILDDVGGEPELLLDGAGPHEAALRDWDGTDVQKGDDVLAHHGADEEIRGFLQWETPLAGGGRMTIEPTRALVAVDVDTGRDTSPAAALKANIDAARALPRELRCRGLGGQITVDFAPIPRRDRLLVEQALTAAFRRDPVETVIAGWTPLSHMELRRQRIRLPLTECLS
jgi:Ribonuclease G/E